MFGIKKLSIRGAFFSTDALVALSIIIVVVLVAFPLVGDYHHQTQLHRDVLHTLSTLYVRDLPSSYVHGLITNGDINDTNVTLLSQIGAFYVSDPSKAKLLAEDSIQHLETKENIGIWFGSTLLASKNSTSYENATYVDTAREVVSGIQSGESVTGFSARAILSNSLQAKYFYFGGYVGDGNISTTLLYSGNITSASLEITINKPFELFINGYGSGNYSASINEYTPVSYSIPTTHLLSNANNLIELRGQQLHIAGGYIKILYSNDISYSLDTLYHFPGIYGYPNLYDGFYVPNDITAMNVYLHFNNTNAPLFLNIGNTTVYMSNASGNRSIIINNTYLQSQLNYARLSNSTIPIRFGIQNATYVINYSGSIDVISVTDVSGSMAGLPLIDAKNGNIVLIDKLLNMSGNRVGLVGYDTTAADSYYHELSNDTTSLKAKVNSWTDGSSTCTCCGINKAVQGFLDSMGLGTSGLGSLVAYYPLNGNVNDHSGRNNNGSLYNSSYVAGINGSAISLSGTNNYSRVNSSIDFDFNYSSFSLSVWIKPTSLSTGRAILSRTLGGNSGYQLYISDGDSDRIEFIRGSSTSGVQSNNRAISAGIWQHLVAVVNTTGTDTVYLYVNGSAQGSGALANNPAFSTGDLFIGKKGYSGSTLGDFNGQIDEVRIYNRALSAAEVSALFNRTGICGNGKTELGEVCDGGVHLCSIGGNKGSQSCNAQCTGFSACSTTAVCGDRIIETGETCDDGNTIDRDGCSSSCLLEGRYKSMIVMSDGDANVQCTEQSTGNSKQDAIKAACNAYQNYSIVVNAIGFGTGTDEVTMQAIAACGNGSYYYANVNELASIYDQLANAIIAQYLEQTVSVMGNVFTYLYSDSYISFNFTQPIVPYGLIATSEKAFSTVWGGIFNVPSGSTVLDAKVTSYSGPKWTDRVLLDGSIIYDLRRYGSSYITLGDPSIISLPRSSIASGIHSVNVTTASSPTNSTFGSSSNKIIFTLTRNMTSFSPIVSSAQGCHWKISFTDGTNVSLRIPSTYGGSDSCGYNATTLGQQSTSISNENDAMQLAVLNLLQQLDFEGDGIVDVPFTQQQLNISTNQITGIPYAWSTEVQVRTWR